MAENMYVRTTVKTPSVFNSNFYFHDLTMEWSRQKSLEFIESYKNKVTLWNVNHSDYKDKKLRHKTLCELALEFGTSKIEVEKKIKGLQTHYGKEKKKLRHSLRVGEIPENVYQSKWFAFKPLSFLDQKNIKNSLDVRFFEQKIPNNSIGFDDSSREGSEIDDGKSLKKKQSIANKKLQMAYSIMNKLYDDQGQKDQYDIFGEEVASMLKKLPSNYARATIQQKLNTVLYEAEILYGCISTNGFSAKLAQTIIEDGTIKNIRPEIEQNAKHSIGPENRPISECVKIEIDHNTLTQSIKPESEANNEEYIKSEINLQ